MTSCAWHNVHTTGKLVLCVDRFITAKHMKLGFKPRSPAMYIARSVAYGDQNTELFYLSLRYWKAE
jgi:hypothetical protein